MAMRRCSAFGLCGIVLLGAASWSGAEEPAAVVTAAAAEAPLRVGEERIPPDEQDTIQRLIQHQLSEMKKAAHGKELSRGQHPKPHGILVAKFTVLNDIDPELKVGLFGKPSSYTAVIRFSSTRSLDDSMPDNHGMAIKLLGVTGAKLLEEEKDAETQDFVLVDAPTFFSKNVASLLRFGQASARAAQTGLEGLEILKAVAPEFPSEVGMMMQRSKVISSPFATAYFSTTPYRFGATAVKYSAQPDGQDNLRAALVEQLTTGRRPARFGFYVQRQGDPKAMLIEDATCEWTSPWERVATIEVPVQDFDFAARERWGDALSFTPWHALKEHRPLGGINRARKVVYRASVAARLKDSGRPPQEPTAADIPRRR